MGKAAPARASALALVGEVRRRDARARELLRTSPRVEALSERDRALVSRLVLGVVATQGLLDQVIAGHLRGGVRLEPKVRDALRLATYELLFLSTPAAVVVSEGVELVRSVSRRAQGLANAVLRRVADEDVPAREAALSRVQAGGAELSDLTLVSGYPTWLLERLVAERGREAARAMALSATEPAPVWVAANRCHHEAAEVRELLEEAGLAPVPETDVAGCFRLGSVAGLARTMLVEDVAIVVSDLSAQRVAALVAPTPQDTVLEVGQGRATKTVLLENAAIACGGPCTLVGVESEPFKVEVARSRIERAGLSGWARAVELDGRLLGGDQALPEELRRTFDRVLVDAPCTGTGTLRRHPEICWRLTPADVEELAELQLSLLGAAAARVAPGGVLAYATCSVMRRENEDVVRAFLISEAGQGFACAGEPFATTPQVDGPDGHFCQLLRRAAPSSAG